LPLTIELLLVVKLQIARTAGIRINDGNDRNESRLERRPHRPMTKTAFKASSSDYRVVLGAAIWQLLKSNFVENQKYEDS
jgi:hypothetical protein